MTTHDVAESGLPDAGKGRRVYLAARYTRREQLCFYAEQLREAGYEVTSRWLAGEHQILDAEMMSLEGGAIAAKRTQFALDDYGDLMRSDICISFTEPPRSEYSRGGRHVEFGIALAAELRVIVVRHRENVFHCLPAVEYYAYWRDCLDALRRERVETGA